jgi:hypothetical protein
VPETPVTVPPARIWRIWAGCIARRQASGSGGDSVAGIERAATEAIVKACGVAIAMLPSYSRAALSSTGLW